MDSGPIKPWRCSPGSAVQCDQRPRKPFVRRVDPRKRANLSGIRPRIQPFRVSPQALVHVALHVDLDGTALRDGRPNARSFS